MADQSDQTISGAKETERVPDQKKSKTEWRDRALLAEARLERHQKRLTVTIASNLRGAVRSPLSAPRLLANIPLSTIDLIRARRRVKKILLRYTVENSTADLAGHAKAISRYLTAEEASKFVELMDLSQDEAGLKFLRQCFTLLFPEPVGLSKLIARAHTSIDWIQNGYNLPVARPANQSSKNQTPKSLLVFHSRAPLVNNGYAARSVEVLNALSAQKWDCTAVTRLGYPNDINRYRHAEVPLLERYGGIPCRLLADPQDGQRGRAPDDYLNAYATRLEREIERSKPTVIHAASNYLNGLASVQAARNTGLPAIYEARGLWEITALSRGDYGESDARFRLASRLETHSASAADAVITLSDSLKNKLVERGVQAEKIFVAPNCVDIASYADKRVDPKGVEELGLHADFIVGYFGAFVAYEGLEILLAALALLKDKGVSIQALLIGGGANEETLKKEAARLRLSDSVKFLEKVSRDTLENYTQLCHAVALPRRATPITQIVPPIKAVEAMARGHPLIVSDLSALRDLVKHEQTGLVVKPDDPVALAGALERLALDRALLQSLANSARQEARRRFDKSVVGSIIINAYEHAIEANNSKSVNSPPNVLSNTHP